MKGETVHSQHKMSCWGAFFFFFGVSGGAGHWVIFGALFGQRVLIMPFLVDASKVQSPTFTSRWVNMDESLCSLICAHPLQRERFTYQRSFLHYQRHSRVFSASPQHPDVPGINMQRLHFACSGAGTCQVH